MSKIHMGSSVDDFLKAEGVFEEAQSQAVQEVVAWKQDQGPGSPVTQREIQPQRRRPDTTTGE